jgi:hypothetical protein
MAIDTSICAVQAITKLSSEHDPETSCCHDIWTLVTFLCPTGIWSHWKIASAFNCAILVQNVPLVSTHDRQNRSFGSASA